MLAVMEMDLHECPRHGVRRKATERERIWIIGKRKRTVDGKEWTGWGKVETLGPLSGRLQCGPDIAHSNFTC